MAGKVSIRFNWIESVLQGSFTSVFGPILAVLRSQRSLLARLIGRGVLTDTSKTTMSQEAFGVLPHLA